MSIQHRENFAVNIEEINEYQPKEEENSSASFLSHQQSPNRNSVIRTLAQIDNRIPLRFVSEQFLY